MTNVALVDDHVLIRQGIASLIGSFADFNVLFEADNGKLFTKNVKSGEFPLPDLVLMDITMPHMDGYETTNWLRIHYPSVKVLALSVMDDDHAIIKMLTSGAKGYILKNSKPTELLTAMESVVEKGYYLNELVSDKLINSINKSGGDFTAIKNASPLTHRETQFLKYACTEKSYKEIAEEMFVSSRTVESYRDNLQAKLNVKGRVGLVIFAIKNKIVEI